MTPLAPIVIPRQLAVVEQYHRVAMQAVFGLSPPATEIDPSCRFLFICFTNRCGSNYLAHLLASTGRLNEAGEFFNGSTMVEHARRQHLRSLGEYLNFLLRGLTMSGWLAAKLGVEQLVMLIEAGLLDQIRDRSRFILIERRDRVAQAVSRLVAVQNRQWTSEQAALLPDDRLVYSREAVEVQLESITSQNHMWLRFFASNGIAPIHLAYEAVVEAPQRHLDEIGVQLGLRDFAGNPARIRIAPQDSPLKRDWAARYRAGG
jgi:trehalose 2-sulfotransferase